MANPWEMDWGTQVNDSAAASAKPVASGSWKEISASYAAGQPARDVAQRSLLQDELKTETDPQNAAAISRTIARLPAAPAQPATKNPMPWEMKWDQPSSAAASGKPKAAATEQPATPLADNPVVALGAGLGAGIGKTALGAQKLVGQFLNVVGPGNPGQWLVDDADKGRAKLTGEVAPYKEASPVSAGVGEFGGEVVSTLPVGGALAAPIKALAASRFAVPGAEKLASAVGSAGFKTGAPVAETLTGKIADVGIRAAGGGITGGVSGELVNPGEGGTAALIGAVLPPALGIASHAGKTVKSLVQPFTDSGQQAIAAGIINKFGAGGPMAINAAELVPGSAPTLAEATGNAGIAGLQRSLRDLRPNAFVERERGNAAARLGAFDTIAGTPEAITAAQAARENAANALYGQAFTADAMRRNLAEGAQATRAPFAGVGLSALPEDLATPGLRELAQRPGFQQAVQDAKRLAANKGSNLTDPLQSLEGLHYTKLALDDALNPMAATAMGRNASGAVMDMRSKLADELAQVSPLYGNAKQAFAEMSKPIDAMQALQGLKLTDAQGNVTLAKAKNALTGLEKKRAEQGIDPAKAISPEQMGVLQAIHDDLLRQANLGAGKAVGSNTFQNIATNNILSTALPGKIGELAVGKAGGLIGQAGQLLYSKPNEAIRNRLVDMALQPEIAAQALQPQLRSSAIGRLVDQAGDVAGRALTRGVPVYVAQD
jgi:hypothetical protein